MDTTTSGDFTITVEREWNYSSRNARSFWRATVVESGATFDSYESADVARGKAERWSARWTRTTTMAVAA